MTRLLVAAIVSVLTLPGPVMAQASMPGMDMAGSDNAHDDHDMFVMRPEGTDVGSAPAPAPPTDHAADVLFDPADMARSREALRRENGAFSGSMILFDLAEYQARKGGDGYRWEGEAWFGGDLNRLLIKTEGEGVFGKPIEDVEVQALYSRAISPFWNAQIGVRHDIAPNPSRTYAVLGIEGIAPYWFHLTGQIFLSDKGDAHARLEESYDERITQRLILQPRAEFNFAAQDVPAIGVGSGLSTFELGARLRYEFRKEFAPYVGVEWVRKTGDTARYARLAGEDPDVANFVAGIRFWF
jgi:copper resistance protein B